ncbi:MAG TPA: energy-coupling factor transporter ATPase [Anaerolineae bacterium]
MPSKPIVRVENVHFTYAANSPQPIQALRGVSLEIHQGEYIAIIGHNGSGKSTLAKHLNGLLVPTQGDVWVEDWNTKNAAHRLAIRSTVGVVFQSPDNQIIATLVEEDVAFGPENLGVPHAELRTRVDWALDTVEMQAYRHRAPHLLSGGQKQRVAIAGILAMKTKVLVLDESTALLDPLGREEVLRVARRLNDEGVTIVAITHLMNEATLADRVIVLEEGQIALEGTPRQVFAEADRLHALQLDVPEITRLAQRLHALDNAFPQVVLTVPEFVNAVQEREKVLLSGNGHSRPSPDLVAPGANQPDAAPADPVISVNRLEHTYLRGTPLESVALRDVNLQAGRGQVIGIIGHTGSGKSTLIQHLNGLLRPQGGEVRVLDYDLRQPKIDLRALRRRVGLVFQFPEAQLFEQHIGDDVAFGPWQMGLRGEELKTRVREAMDAVGLAFDLFKDRPLYGLSGGERRRAALAGVLAIKPEILVLDEPTAGLDPRGHYDILDRIMALHREWGTTLVIISHNMEEIARLCDRIYVLSDGKTVLNGTPRQVFAERSRVESFGLGVPQVTAALQELRERGMAVRGDALTVDEAEQALAYGRI